MKDLIAEVRAQSIISGSKISCTDRLMLQAAERRMKDDKTCGTADSAGKASAEQEAKKAQAESVGIDAVDLTGGSWPPPEPQMPHAADIDDDDDVVVLHEGPSSRSTVPTPKVVNSPTVNADREISKSASRPVGERKTIITNPTNPKARSPPPVITNAQPRHAVAPPSQASLNGDWQCNTCTLVNPPHILQCDACATPRPVQAKPRGQQINGWMCEFCGSGPREMTYWSCGECGWVRKWG